MADATLKRVLEELKGLNPAELHQVEHKLRELMSPASKEAEREAALLVLEASGLVREVKRPPMVARRGRLPIPIEGKPLSETIVEERR